MDDRGERTREFAIDGRCSEVEGPGSRANVGERDMVWVLAYALGVECDDLFSAAAGGSGRTRSTGCLWMYVVNWFRTIFSAQVLSIPS